MPEVPATLVYLPDHGDLVGILREWPEEVELALLLHASGSSSAIPFHLSDKDTLIAHIAKATHAETSGIAVFPALEGYPTMPLRYSDEQQLLKFLDVPDHEILLGPAHDFALNRRFALDEGLEAMDCVGQVRVTLSGEADTSLDLAKPSPSLTEASGFAVPRDGMLAPETQADAAREIPLFPEATVQEPLHKHPRFEATLSRSGSEVTLCPKGEVCASTLVPLRNVLACDDLQTFSISLPKEASNRGALRMPLESLPCAVLPRDGGERDAEVFEIGKTLTVVVSHEPIAARCARTPQQLAASA